MCIYVLGQAGRSMTLLNYADLTSISSTTRAKRMKCKIISAIGLHVLIETVYSLIMNFSKSREPSLLLLTQFFF